MADTGFTVPALATIVDRVRADLDSALPGADSRLRRTGLRALSYAVGGTSWLLHKWAGEIAKETLPDCASETGVKRWQAMFGLPDIQPVRSTGDVDCTGVNGSTITTADSLVRNDGVEYNVTSGATISGGVATITVQAVDPGTDGDMVAGQVLTFAAPVTGVDSQAQVASGGLTGGVDAESLTNRRTRVLNRMGDPPQGGSDADFEQWTREAVSNVREVYVSPNEPALGHVTVRFTIEPTDGDPANALPTAGQVQTATDYIAGTLANNFEDGRAPVPISKPLTGTDAQSDGRIALYALTGQAISVQITNLSPDTTAIRTAVEDSLKAMFLAKGQPGGTLKVSHFWGAIDAAQGEYSHELTQIDGVAPADVTIGADSFPTLGTVTYV